MPWGFVEETEKEKVGSNKRILKKNAAKAQESVPWGGGLNAYSVEQLSVIEPVARSMPGYLQEMTPEITSIMAQVRWKLNRIEPSLNRQPFFLIKSKKALARLGFYVFLFGVSPKGLNNPKRFFFCAIHMFSMSF